MNTYDIGSVVRLLASFTDINGTPGDPSTVTCKVEAPDGTVTSYVYGIDVSLIRSGTGEYYIDIAPNLPNEWYYRFESTGTLQAAMDAAFSIDPGYF